MDTLTLLDHSDENIWVILEQSKNWLQGKKLNACNIMELVTSMMANVQKIVIDCKQGVYKKKLILTVLHKIIKSLKFDTDDEKNKLIILITETVPSTIDLLINVQKGAVDLLKNAKKNNIFECCLQQ